MEAEDKKGTLGGCWPWPPEHWAEAGTLPWRPRYLLGHLEAHIGAELQHLTHLLRGGWDPGGPRARGTQAAALTHGHVVVWGVGESQQQLLPLPSGPTSPLWPAQLPSIGSIPLTVS